MPSKNKDIDGVNENIKNENEAKKDEKLNAQASEKIKNLLNEVNPSSIDFLIAFEYVSLIQLYSGLFGRYSLFSQTLNIFPVIKSSPALNNSILWAR